MGFAFDVGKIVEYIPSVEKPTYKQTVNTRLKWTGIALTLYFMLSSITAFGVVSSNFEQYRFFEIVLGSKFGSLMTLGVGPLVTGGILLQLLVGSKILDWDTTTEEGRTKFQIWNKFLSVLLCFVEAAAFVLAGAIPIEGGALISFFVMLQLASGALIVILLDEIVQKWGYGSGISLFIAAGVGSQILIRSFSPFTTSCLPGNIISCMPSATNPPSGLVWNFMINVFTNNPELALTAAMPLISTGIIFLLVVFVQNVRVEIPISFSTVRGFGRSWPLKLLYTSNIPVILTMAVVANLQLMARFGATTDVTGMTCGILGCFDSQGQPASGLIYYLTAPKGIISEIILGTAQSSEIIRAGTYTIFISIFAMIFSVFWITTSGMDAESVADQIDSIGLQIPGFRKNKRVIQSVLNRYIPYLAVLGGLMVGLLAAFADFLGALGTGTGMLLTVMIVYNYYEELSSQRLDEAHHIVRKLFGE